MFHEDYELVICILKKRKMKITHRTKSLTDDMQIGIYGVIRNSKHPPS